MNEKLLQKLSKLNVCVVSHIFASGPALDLEEFLKKKTKRLLFIGHPFPYREDRKSFYRLYKTGNLVKEHKAINWKLAEVFFYIKDALYTLLWVGTQKEKVDLYIGSDNFTAYLGLLLKKWGKVKKVVLYTIDYMENRFQNPVMNYLYHYFDKSCLKECSIVWNVSPAIQEARLRTTSKQERWTKQIVVPLGMWHKRIPKRTFGEKNRHQLVFLGHILEKQGLDVVLEGLPRVVEKFPKARLVILGTGPHEELLKEKAKKLKIEKYVDFRGYIVDHRLAENILAESMIGVAMYKPDPSSFTYHADPAKLKNYLSARLPIVLTDVPPISIELARQKCAVIAKYDREDFAKKTIKLLRNEKTLKDYEKNADRFAAKFDWDTVFTEALKKTVITF